MFGLDSVDFYFFWGNFLVFKGCWIVYIGFMVFEMFSSENKLKKREEILEPPLKFFNYQNGDRISSNSLTRNNPPATGGELSHN